jgi:hypothetical protein
MAAKPSKPRRISVTPAATQMRTSGPGVIIPAVLQSRAAARAGSRPHRPARAHRQQVRSRSMPLCARLEALFAAIGWVRYQAGSPKQYEPEPTAPGRQSPAARATNDKIRLAQIPLRRARSWMRIPGTNDWATISARNSAACARRRSPIISIRCIGAATVAANTAAPSLSSTIRLRWTASHP